MHVAWRWWGAAGAAALLLGSAALLSACGSKPEAACPRGVIPADAANVTRFRDGPGRDLIDVVNEGEIQNILVQCTYDKKVIDVDLQVAVAATRGPADRTGAADFQYFVAIVGPDEKILTKQPFTVHFEFKDNRNHLGRIEQLVPKIPVADPLKGPQYQIVVGFQLTPDELAWNRSQRAKALH
jgi:hypothetical protein